MDEVCRKRFFFLKSTLKEKSAEGVTLSGVLDTKLYADTTLESLVTSSAEGARKYFRISQAKGQGVVIVIL